jgi:hypothetical protein
MSSSFSTKGILSYLHNTIQKVNQSKLFAGLVVVTLNISSKFVTVKLSKSVESYLKHTFSRDVLIFCIVWMGSREIYISVILTLVFIVLMDFLFNEESSLCILPEAFKNYHISLLEESEPTMEEIQKAKEILERANKTGNNTTDSLQVSSDIQSDMGFNIKW